MTKKMKAIVFEKHGDPSQLKYTYTEMPQLGPKEVLVKVKACALNHLDLWTLKGIPGIHLTMPHILGCDVAGEIVETGKKARGIPKNKLVILSPGIADGKSRFCRAGWDSLDPNYKIRGLQVNGGYAEYVKAHKRDVIPVSKRLSPAEWASVPLVFLTAWHMLVTRAQLRKGEHVLIHGAGSGVGSAGIRIAKYLDATVITTVGSEGKVRKARALGANFVVNYRKKDFRAEVLKITKGKGVEVVLDHIGPATFQNSLACLAKKGRLVTCGVTSGPTVSYDLRMTFMRQLSIFGCYMGGKEELRKVIRLVEKGKLKPVVDKIYPLSQAAEALRRMQNRVNFGKIILTP